MKRVSAVILPLLAMAFLTSVDAPGIQRMIAPDLTEVCCFADYDSECTCVAEKGRVVIGFTFGDFPSCDQDASCGSTPRVTQITLCAMSRYIASLQPGVGGTLVPDANFGDPGHNFWAVPLSPSEAEILNELRAPEETIPVPMAVTDAAVLARNPPPQGTYCIYTIGFSFRTFHLCRCGDPNHIHSISGAVIVQYLPAGGPVRSVSWSHGSWEFMHNTPPADCMYSVPSIVNCTGFCPERQYHQIFENNESTERESDAFIDCQVVDPEWEHPEGETLKEYGGTWTQGGPTCEAEVTAEDIFGSLGGGGSAQAPNHVMTPQSHIGPVGWEDYRNCAP